MFYSQYLLSKKGPLGIIWIAAHLERKLRRKQITETDIGDTVDTILYSDVPIALRISSHLLVGVVRIYARKVDYLLSDCSEALVKIRRAFETSSINLPPNAQVAPYHAITLPELLDFEELGGYVSPERAAHAGTRAEFEHHVIDRDLITLQQKPMEVPGVSQSLFTFEGGFAESSSPYAISGIPTEVEIIQKFHVPADIPVLLNEEDVLTRSVEEDVLPPLPMEEDIDIEEMEISRERLELEGEVEAVEKSKMVSVEDVNVTGDLRVVGQEMTIEAEGMKVCIEDHIVEAAVEVEAEHRGIEVEAEQRGVEAETEQHRIEEISIEQVQEVPRREVEISERPVAEPEKDVLGAILGVKMAEPSVKPTAQVSEKRKRKQRLIYDEVAAIPSLDMKRQLGSSSNLIRFRRKAPCNKYQIWLAEGGDDIGRKFLEPSLPGMCPELKRLSSFIVNVEPPEEAEAVPETVRPTAKRIATEVEPSEEVEAVLETVRPTAKRLSMEVVEDIELDVEEIFEGDELVELEADTTVRHAIKQTEIVSSPRVSPQPPEESYSEVQVEATSSVKRRLEFEKGLLPGQEQAIEVGIEAEQVETLEPPLFPAQVGAVPVAGEMKTVPRKAKKPFREEFLESARPSEVSPAEEVLEEEMVTEQPEIPPSEGLGFLAESREDEALAYVDTDSEAFGKFKEEKISWASRTRAVGMYLKGLFDSQPVGGQLVLSLNNILKGKTRKECARMFFEILVLRSKGFIQVEQMDGTSDIFLRPTEPLMKGNL